MSQNSVIIDDDDVVVVEPVEIIDDDVTSTAKDVVIDIVDLDEEPLPAPKPMNGDTAPSSTTNNHNMLVDNERESSFARLLKNNTILNKIVQRCLNMENNGGMPRVIHKTLMPLYKDADNKFKESEAFSKVLNTILWNLKTDPDHKFLHIKSLCEELKAGKYRRKVPFVTLTTDLNKKKDVRPLPSENEMEEDNDAEITAVIIRKKSITKKMQAKCKKKRYSNRLFNKRRKRRKNTNKKTDIINVDNTDDESVITLDADDENDDDSKTADEITEVQPNNDVGIASTENVLNVQSLDDNSNNSNKENSQIKKENDPTRSSNNNSALDKNISQSDREKNQIVVDDDDQNASSDNDLVDQIVDDSSNHSNKGNSQNESDNEITRPVDDLLVVQTSVGFEEHSAVYAKARRIEEEIALCKKMIVELEQEEVTSNCLNSAYIQCDKYKAKIVELYKNLCKLTGNGDGNLMRPRVVRLHVAEGHPAGPVRALERFLNDNIDENGAVPLPDFHDVLTCVEDSNVKDKLGWSRQEIMREALALFTHCGNALRKNRQRREYKDLLSLVRDKTQDDYDPANEDPLLLAKLEENKLIARAKENEILDRYSRIDYLPNNQEKHLESIGLESIRVTRTSAYDSDTDSNTDEESIPQKRLKTNTTIDTIPNLEVNIIPNKTLTENNRNEAINTTCNKKVLNEKEIIKCPTVTTIDNPMQNVVSCHLTQIPQINTKAPIHNTLIIRTPNAANVNAQNVLNTPKNPLHSTCISFYTSIQNIINIAAENTMNTIDNPINTKTQNAFNNTIPNTYTTQNVLKTTQNGLNTTQNALNPTQNALNTTTNQSNTTEYPLNATQNAKPPILHLNPVKEHTATNQIAWPDKLQKIGVCNRYVVAFDGKSTQNTEPEKNSNNTNEMNLSIPQNNEKHNTNVANSIETNVNTSDIQDVTVKEEKVKEEPIDIQSLLDSLGDNYISTVFDIEDPFLIIDISSDSSDDEDL